MQTPRRVDAQEFEDKLSETIAERILDSTIFVRVKGCRQNLEIRVGGKIFRVFPEVKTLIYIIVEET